MVREQTKVALQNSISQRLNNDFDFLNESQDDSHIENS